MNLFNTIRRFLRIVNLLAVLFLFVVHAYGQEFLSETKKVPVKFFTTENGLSHNNVTSIVKDRDGFMWVGTDDGLNRFDGYTFTPFYHTDKDSTSISNDVIRKLLIDSKGRLWAGTYNGLNLLDDKKENFKVFLHSPTNQNTISQNTILCLMEDRNQQLWVGTYWGLNKIDLNTFHITHYYYDNNGKGLADNEVNALLEDRQGKIWVCTPKGINILGPQGIESSIPSDGSPGGLPSEIIIDVAQDSTGAIYFGTNGRGLHRLDNENDRSFEPLQNRNQKSSFINPVLASLAVGPDNSILVGTNGSGLYEYVRTGNFIKIISTETKILDLLNIQKIFIDNEKNYWFGSWGAGLIFVSGHPPRFEHYRFLDSEMEQTGKTSVLALAEDHNKKIWIGTDGGGLFKFDPLTKSFTSFKHSESNLNSLSSNVAKSLLVDKHNNLYVGTFSGGLNYVDTRSNRITRFLHDPEKANSISTNHVWSLLQNKDGRIFVGLLGGFDEFLPQTQQFKSIAIASSVTVNRSTASVFAMAEDKNSRIWVGTRLAGLHQYDPNTNLFESFTHTPGDSKSFPSNEILCIKTDTNGNLLVGTDNKGLFRVDPLNFSFSSVAPEFEEKNITSVLEDSQSRIWFTSFDGLHQYNPATQAVQSYTTTDLMQGLQYNEGAALQSADGTFYFGGTNGLNVFNPNKIHENRSKATAVFTRLSLYHDQVKVQDKTGLLPESLNHLKEITFQPDQNVFTIEFVCLEYQFPKKNKYKYFLKGFDKHWNEINESRIATYTNLPPGEYKLIVGASNSDGYWNDEAASIQIIVIPRWYQRLSVRTGLGILFMLAMVGIIHVRTRFLFKQKRKLELMVNARTRTVETQKAEIKDKNEKLEQAYEEANSANEELHRVNLNLEKIVEERTIELRKTIRKLMETDAGLATFLYRASHDLRGPVSSLQGLLHLAKSQNHQQELELYLKSMEKTSKGMLRLLGRLSEISVLFGSDPKMEVVHLDEVIQSVKERLQSVPDYEKVKIEFENNIGQSVLCDKTLLTQIIFNIMENSIVFKTSVHPFVNCSIHLSNQSLNVQIKDNGVGISPAVLPKVFDMFFRGDEDSKGNGLGLFIAKRAVDLLRGTIQIESEQFKETIVTVSLPVKH